MVLVLKLFLTPFLIAAATLTGRRWGPGVSGWLIGFPLTSGPIALILALQQGPDFAAISLFGFAGFFWVVGGLLPGFGIAGTFILATLAAVAVNGISLKLVH
ncbi:MAG: hypothetical protein EHM45_02595 [Desulfobacteraceae bacterium]|nr:MAG: hypothetical protein EHM45_02595 [Desulfobacteraceae bacterium]